MLHNLRRTLPDLDRFLGVTPRTLQWRADAPFWLDVAAFEATIVRADQEAGDAGLAALREAVGLYTGDLLLGCDDEWLLGERERLRRRYLEALALLTTLLEAGGEHGEAIRHAERLLQEDPLREETYRLLMRLHDVRGDRARALRVYHVCAATLERELGAEPSAPTRRAYEALLPAERGSTAAERRAGRVGGPPLVGRQPERERLTTLWRATESGQAQLVLVTGEPGIGKTRLVDDFRAWCAHRGAVTAVARSYAAEGALAYGPLVAWLRADPLGARLRGLDRARLAELARLLPELLSELPGLPRPEPRPESDQRQRLFDAAARAILAAGGPLLLVADDLHWWDRESLQFLHYLLRAEPEARLLVAATARREDVDRRHPMNDLRAGLQALGRFTEIELDRLSRGETTALAERITRHPLEARERDQLYLETEGNPLFVVEALRAGWKSGPTERGWTSPKVQAVIEARLGQLSEPARELVGIAATIGREFTSEVLAFASEADEETLVRGLDELWRRRVIREQGTDAYDFSHDKIREVAYLGLSPALRRRLHLRVAQALERLRPRDPGPVSGQIAGHYERAGAAGPAVRWYQRAAEAAQQLYANVEAIRLLDRALDLLHTLPESDERQAQELAVLTAIPGPLVAVEGYASSRLAEVQPRALELTRRLGVDPAPPLLRSLALASLSAGDFAATREAGEQLLARGEHDADDVLRVEGAYVLGIVAFWSGELDAARRHFEAAVERYRPEQRGTHLQSYGQDPKVVCLSRLGNTLWLLGRPDAAIRARDAARALAEEIGHPLSRGAAVWFAALLALDMRDRERLREDAATLRLVGSERLTASESMMWVFRTNSQALDGYLDVVDGRTEAGLARIQRALEEARGATPAPGFQASLARVLLEASTAAGDARMGLGAADRALGESGIRVWEAEVRRLRAEFLAALGATSSDVEAELARALEVARRQGAKMLELRVAMSVLHLRLKRGDSPGVTEARDRLAAIIDALPEGRETLDVRDATALLAQG